MTASEIIDQALKNGVPRQALLSAVLEGNDQHARIPFAEQPSGPGQPGSIVLGSSGDADSWIYAAINFNEAGEYTDHSLEGHTSFAA